MTTQENRLRNGVSLQLDAQQAFQRWLEDIEHFAALDPNIAWTKQILESRFQDISEDDTIRLAASMWPQFKAMLMPDLCPPWWPGHPHYTIQEPSWQMGIGVPIGMPGEGSVPRTITTLRHGLVEGEMLRRRIEQDLNGPLSLETLQNTAERIRQWEHSSDSTRTKAYDQAREEVERMTTGPERKVVAAFLGGMVLGGAIGLGLIYLLM
ncbi:hypothetical protein [Streptomyces megasporus]|uniref:hypothetical protein n=1 Tax=Streptomyces megasporus TaxID=44060 RepID=UPI0012FF240D|nr:hypothetical protein [Streptomyces megasporus]